MIRIADFSFNLPKNLIARYPKVKRSSCRLLCLDGLTGALMRQSFSEIVEKFVPGDLLVFNNTRVIPARLFGRKDSGGKIEMLVERVLDDKRVLAHVRTSNILKAGAALFLGDDESIRATIIMCHDGLFEVCFDDSRDVMTLLNEVGHIPLPFYINRLSEVIDREFYQTVYSECPGAVASPTAGLHFDEALLSALSKKGIKMVFVTLHIGSGTFQPVRVENIEDHVMHAEYVEVSKVVVDAILACKARGNQVVAVGTSSVRSLESAAMFAKKGIIAPFSGYTRIFIYPGYRFRVIDALITNFHLPKSTLIMLVAAFAGHKHILVAYQQAIRKSYRFFSYGDAMFITHNPVAAG